MKILFAVSNENISEAIKREYQNNYRAALITKNVYYFNAIIKELQNNPTYDCVIISEDLEPFANNNYATIDKFIIEKLVNIREAAKGVENKNLPIILITTDRHIFGDNLITKIYEAGIYNALVGEDRSIENVCKLIDNPREKAEARQYYKMQVENSSQSENEDSVKEIEIKNILAHYKRLGKSEEKYVDSFNNIASQYTDSQLKVIIRFLPLNVKAVLEAQSEKYQQLITFQSNYKSNSISNDWHNSENTIKEKEEKIYPKEDNLMEQISETKIARPVIIPNTVNPNIVKKLEVDETEKDREVLEPIEGASTLLALEEDSIEQQPEVVEPVKRGRGRPKKIVSTEEEPKVKRGRGRPKKIVPIEEETINLYEIEEPEKEIQEIKEEIPKEQTYTLPGFETIEEELLQNETQYVKSDVSDAIEDDLSYTTKTSTFENTAYNEKETLVQANSQQYQYQNIEHLVSKDRKIISFVGTSKNGTSFIVNNMAQLLSRMNIKIAILDMTQNRNSYYIYTQNDETLRKKAHKSIEKLKEGIADGIRVSKNLTVYTATPGEEPVYYEADKVLKTLIDNYSLVLIDCDFDTPIGYFDNSQEIYLIQSMDILTIQPLTAFLRDLKARDVLKQEKIRIVMNKVLKVRGLNAKVLVGGMAKYNDPSMSFMTDLFDRNSVKVCAIPFDAQVYANYLGTLVDCDLSIKGYNKQFMNALKELGNMIYPLLNGKANKKSEGTYTPPSINNNFNNSTPFSSDMDNTLNQMRNRY